MITPAWISLGSNMGDRRGLLDDAVAALADCGGVIVKSVSSYHETQPVGGPPGQGPFLNAAAELETTLTPHRLLEVLQTIERRARRVREVRWGERTLDLDILIFGNKFLETNDLKLPHPRLALRRFVLEPLVEIAPQVRDRMTNRTAADLLANLNRRPRLLAIDSEDDPLNQTLFRALVNDLPAFGIRSEELRSLRVPSEDPLIDLIETLLGQAEAIRASRWAAETLRVPWIVMDFCLDREVRRAARSWWGTIHPAQWRVREPEMSDGLRRVRLAVKAALSPTLVLVLPGKEDEGRKPAQSTVPQLRPDGDDPLWITEEVLATCRGIAGA